MTVWVLSPSGDVATGWGAMGVTLADTLAHRGLRTVLSVPAGEPLPGGGFAAGPPLPPLDLRFRRPNVVGRAQWGELPKWTGRPPDVIHTIDGFPAGVVGARLARRLRCRLVIATQGTYAVAPLGPLVSRLVVGHAYRAADAVVAPSTYTARHIEAATGVRPLVVHNPVDNARFQQPADAEGIRLRTGFPRFVLSVGHVKPRKGFDVALRAFAQVAPQFPDVGYVVVGPDGWGGHLLGLAAQLGVGDRFLQLGRLSDDDVRAAFHACEVYVHTPRIDGGAFEGFGLVYLEAGACGKPVLASDSGGASDAVVDGRTGLVVPENDVDATAAALTRLLDDQRLRERLGRGGREWARHHDWSAYVDDLLALMRPGHVVVA